MLHAEPSKAMTPAPLLVGPRDAATLLAIGERALWSLSVSNAIPSVKLGRSRRYSVAELEAWIAARCPTHPNAADAIRADLQRGKAARR